MAWAMVVTTAAGLAASDGPLEAVTATTWTLMPFVFALCGALIVWKQPKNGVGWVLILPGLALLRELMPILDVSSPPASLQAFDIAQLWFDNVSWMFLIFPVFHLLQVFPDGSLVSRRWRVFLVLEVMMFAVLATVGIFVDQIGPLDASWSVSNPIGLFSFSSVEGVFNVLWAVGLTVLTIGGFSAIVLRWRRGGPTERHQIKWLLLAVAFFAISYVAISANESWQGESVFDMVLALSLLGIPVAIVISVTKYRLYEIDRIISRTFSYAIVVTLLGLVYGALLAGVGSLFDDSLVVATSTLAVAVLFRPLRRRIQVAVDRRFNRSRFDAELVIEDFIRSLAGRVEPGGLVTEWIDVVARTMGPEKVAVWTRAPE